jgi:ubiquinone/menaquinone biosynthesis C-methylase UbiE
MFEIILCFLGGILLKIFLSPNICHGRCLVFTVLIVRNWCFSVGCAEKIACPDSSVQLITAAQACHWFDLPKFYAEADRVLVPGGILALYGYRLPTPKCGSTNKQLCNIIEKVLL